MGFFSWKTADTKEPIRNVYAEEPHTLTNGAVYMLQPNGEPSIREDNYQGYGVFGGVDAYAWLARMNLGIDGEDDDIRGDGIDLYFGEGYDGATNPTLQYPLKFSFDPAAIYEKLPPSEDDPNQGYFMWAD